MAEVVQRNSENSVREIEDLRQIKLFSEEKIRRMMEVRKRMEAKINRNFSKNIDDYKEYIEHELLILEKIHKCRERKKISEKTNSVDYSIIKRIRRLYETALQRFPSEYSLHEGFFEFCKKYSFTSTASQAADKMLKLFASNPEVWKLAADWYYKLNDINKALQTVNEGLTMNPQSQKLYSKALELELRQIETSKCSPQEQEEKEKVCCENIQNYIDLILSKVNSLEYIIKILSTLEKHNFTLPAQKKILDYLFQNHIREEDVWQTMAQRERKGLHFLSDPNEQPRCQNNFTKSCLLYCVDKYKQGLSLVEGEKKKKLWFKYIETLLEIKEEIQDSISLNSIDFLENALKQAHSERCLEERHYMVWLDNKYEDEARRILEEATTFYPTSEELWKMRMRHEIMTDKVKRVESTFQAAKEALKDKAINMWLMRLRYHSLSSEFEKIEAIFEEGVEENQPAEISNVLKPKYMEWIALHKDMTAARKKYREIAVRKPYCKELHVIMSRLEISEMSVDYNSLQEVHEIATNQFGSEDVNIILNYIKFILFRKPHNLEEKIKSLYAEAEQRLSPLLFQQFRGEYQLVLAEK